jgi:hypothetical protein
MEFIIKQDNISIRLLTDNDKSDTKTSIDIFVETPDNYLANLIEEDLLEKLSESYNMYGHLINPKTTNNSDISFALSQLKDYQKISIPKIKTKSLPDNVLS